MTSRTTTLSVRFSEDKSQPSPGASSRSCCRIVSAKSGFGGGASLDSFGLISRCSAIAAFLAAASSSSRFFFSRSSVAAFSFAFALAACSSAAASALAAFCASSSSLAAAARATCEAFLLAAASAELLLLSSAAFSLLDRFPFRAPCIAFAALPTRLAEVAPARRRSIADFFPPPVLPDLHFCFSLLFEPSTSFLWLPLPPISLSFAKNLSQAAFDTFPSRPPIARKKCLGFMPQSSSSGTRSTITAVSHCTRAKLPFELVSSQEKAASNEPHFADSTYASALIP
mmetsp:Transcript_67732/g.147523  ORF Transcript_67732/g.147523 Transcript_67732/m.147523 type:complete len:285 (-) Transcript_67732:766-1620(-)